MKRRHAVARLGPAGVVPWLVATVLLLSSAPTWAGTRCEASLLGEPRGEPRGDLPGELPMLRRLGQHFWQVPAGVPANDPAGTATMLVVVRDGARTWLLGSGPTPAFGAALACVIQRELGRTVTDVINTRAHAELALGNAAFPQARVWALGDVARAMKRQCPQCLARLKDRLGAAGASLTPSAIRVPAHRVDRGAAASGELGPFRWWALWRAPGSPVLVLQHRADRVVVAQGLVWPGAVPDLRETTLAQMRESLGQLQALFQAAPQAVPRAAPHAEKLLGDAGGVGSPADVASHLAYLDALQHAVGHALQRGDVEGSPSAALALPEFAALAQHAERHPLNLQRAWRELEVAVFK